MALVTCQDCKRSISDTAPACIHCGRPAGANQSSPRPTSERLAAEQFFKQSPASKEAMPASNSSVPKSRTAKEWLGGALGFGVTYLFFHLPVNSLALKMLAGGVVGMLIGLIPHAQARKRGATTFAAWSIAICGLGGALAGLLFAIPLCVALTWYAQRKRQSSASFA
jgi:hypothetical protein